MSAAPSLKLTYYDFGGRASTIRKVLAMAQIPFVDERISRAEFLTRKPTLPYGKIPVLEVDGDYVLAESSAILRFVGRLAGMYPSLTTAPFAAALVDEVLDLFDDLFEHVMLPSYVASDPVEVQQIREALMTGPLPQAVALIENRLAQIAADPFFQKDPTTVYIHEALVWDYVSAVSAGEIDHIPSSFIKQYETIMAMYNKVEATPTVRQPSIQEQPPIAQLPTKMTLTYFDGIGRAEHIRLALHIGGLPFEDERLSWEQFLSRKPTLPNEQVPVLQMNVGATTELLAQSQAILRFVGTLSGLYPAQDPLRAAQVDEVLSHIGDLLYAIDQSTNEEDPAKRKQLREQLAASTIPEALRSLDQRIAHFKLSQQTKASFAVGGDALTIADLAIYSVVALFKSGYWEPVPTTIVDAFTHVVHVSETVRKHPRVQSWYEQHPSSSAL